MQKSAIISECGKYRYELTRTWDASKPQVLFICLNPSTADHEKDDRTLGVCINYAKRWGYGSVVIANLFAYRSRDISNLYTVDDPVGPENDLHIKRLCKETSLIICAWGNNGSYKDRNSQVMSYLKNYASNLKCLRKLKNGSPSHPLYNSKELEPVPLY